MSIITNNNNRFNKLHNELKLNKLEPNELKLCDESEPYKKK